ncbi:MAG: hypothetical protein IPP17_29810 [Bacteroidetes bacterium]|nr:hypothetical protein [Bacteroidota bacterium]
MAIGIKEYAILPSGLSLVFWWLMREVARDRPVAILKLGIFFFLALTLTLTPLHGGPNGLIEYYLGRQSYTSEFLPWIWGFL